MKNVLLLTLHTDRWYASFFIVIINHFSSAAATVHAFVNTKNSFTFPVC